MWSCPICHRNFKNNRPSHYCGDKTVGDFLTGKSETVLHLFDHLIARFNEIGPVNLSATKSMIVIAADSRFAYIINLGKTFIDLVLPFKVPYENNFCFRKIAQVPGTSDFNHHLRILFPEDLNEEVFTYMRLAYENGKNI